MNEYIFLYRGRDDSASAEQMQQTMQKWAVWMKKLQSEGHLKVIGNPLDNRGSVVEDKDRLVIDGPYAEAKDVIAGYTLITAKDLAEATELAKGCPILDVGGSVEVRPTLVLPNRDDF